MTAFFSLGSSFFDDCLPNGFGCPLFGGTSFSLGCSSRVVCGCLIDRIADVSLSVYQCIENVSGTPNILRYFLVRLGVEYVADFADPLGTSVA